MYIFGVINEVAVFGATLLMMAVSVVWYSSMLFGTTWSKATGIVEENTEKNTAVLGKMIVLTFLSYFVLLNVLAYLISFASQLSMTPLQIALTAVMFIGAFTAVLVIWERKSLSYFLVHVGFMAVFSIGGTFVLQYWPW